MHMTTKVLNPHVFTDERGCHGCLPECMGAAAVWFSGSWRPQAHAALGAIGGANRRTTREVVQSDLRLERPAGLLSFVQSGDGNLACHSRIPLGTDAPGH